MLIGIYRVVICKKGSLVWEDLSTGKEESVLRIRWKVPKYLRQQ